MKKINSIIDGKTIGKRMSFTELVNDYSIVIPVIQRDYAQGRQDNNVQEIRKNFVENLILYIEDSQKASHDLDFIYGTVLPINDRDYEFIPLDGQQRLTTLFLLHLYVAGRCGKFDDFKDQMKGRFSYKTRNSSTMFCEKLISTYKISEKIEKEGKTQNINRETNVFEELKRMEDASVKDGKKPTESMLSMTIKNQGWFFKSWLQDPTVAGMLVMLDEIDRQFMKKSVVFQKAYERLFEQSEDENPPITFLMLPLNGYSRTDDLYIKMNARGIHLTDFENFKARLENFIEENNLNFTDFKRKVDRDWSEYLWKFRGKEDNTDGIMENLFRNFIAFSYRAVDADQKTIKSRMEYLLEQNGKKMRFTFAKYCSLEVFHKKDSNINKERLNSEKETVGKVIDFFDIFCDTNISPMNYSNSWFKPSGFIEGSKIKKDASFSNRLRLYAYLQYHRTHSEIDPFDLEEWLRLIRNLDDATDIDDAENFYRALESIDDLLDHIGTKEVLKWLSEDTKNYTIKFFRRRQMKEECIKAQLRTVASQQSNVIIYDVIHNCDIDPYMKGQMGFILEFAECYKFYAEDTILNMSQQQLSSCASKLKEYSDKVIRIFNLLSSDNPGKISSEHLLERALLTIGVYMRGNSAKRYNFCNRMNDPYNSWKTLLFVEEGNNDITKLCREYFHTLLDKINNNNDIETELENIISSALTTNVPNPMPIWRKKLIENKILIEYCKQGFIYFENWDKLDEDKPNIILFNQSQMNHYHSEFWSRELYSRLNGKYDIHYHSYKRHEDKTNVYISFENNSQQKYTFEIYHWDKVWYYIIYDKDRNDVTASMPNITMNLASGMDGDALLKQAYLNILQANYTIYK